MKIILVGETKTGKSRWVLERFATQDPAFWINNPTHKLQYDQGLPTIGADVFQLDGVNLWDCGGDPRLACLPEGYWLQADGMIVVSFMPEKWHDQICEVLQCQIPAVYCQPHNIPSDILDTIKQVV